MVAFRQKLEQIQFGTIILQMCAPIWERAVSALILRGDLPATDFETAVALWLAAEHYPPPMPWIDPAKDVVAIRDALEAGLMCRRQAVAERGYDVETLDAEIAADRERETRMGINFNLSAATPEPQKDAGSE